ncbi:MAG: ATP-binding protein, partial [Nitrosopumilaceae archaeon]|nr:ATP-binding protein [Nitrosopumilaceae archaeon]
LLEDGFKFIIASVSSDGLDDSWLGKEIDSENLVQLEKLSKKYGFNLNFEGGEAETLVIACPLFSKQIVIQKSHKVWDGYRGRFEIEEAKID